MKAIPLWTLFALGSAFFAGLTAFFGKLGVANIDSDLATFVRTLIIAALVGAILSCRQEWKPLWQMSAATWGFLVLSGVATGLSWLCYYRALQLGPVSRVAPIDKLGVVFAIVLGLVFLGETLSWAAMLGALMIVGGAVVMVAFG